jgi:hypothetical protein
MRKSFKTLLQGPTDDKSGWFFCRKSECISVLPEFYRKFITILVTITRGYFPGKEQLILTLA